jgi:3-oxoadipate enol-lactonase
MGWFSPAPAARLRRVRTARITMQVAEAGAGRPIVFIHGLGWNLSLWHPELARLGDRYHIVAGDTRGHGGSDAPAGPYDIAMFAADWAALMDAMGLRDACVVGLSQGGMIAQRLAAERADLVAALVLVATACDSDPAAEAAMEARITAMQTDGAEASAMLAAQGIFSPGFREGRPDELARFIAWRVTMPMAPIAAATRAAFGMDLKPLLPRITAPTLVISGAEDRLTPPPRQAELAALIPGAELASVAASGHIIPAEQPAAFAAMLDAFLARAFPAEGAGQTTTRETHHHA